MRTAALELDVLEQALPSWDVPGLQVVVVAGGEVLHAGALGVRGGDDPTPLTDRTLFDHGSCGKAYTGLLASLLHDDGVLDLDAPVRELVPELELPDPAAAAEVTVRDLLAHRSGLSRHDLAWILNGHWERGELVHRLRHLPMASPLRAQWLYTNLGYALAGEAIGRAAGLPWEELLTGRVLEPLGMTGSSGRPVGDSADRACGHVVRDGRPVVTPHRDLNAVAPAGQLVVPAVDAARWLLLHTGEDLLPRQAVDRTHEPQIVLPEGLPFPELELRGYALGWIEGRYRGRAMSWHSGGVDGFMTQTLVLPEQRIGVLLSATSHLSPFTLAGALTVADQLLGEPDGDWLARLAPPPAEPAPGPRLVPADGLAGSWSHPGYGTLSVAPEGSAALGTAELVVTSSDGRQQLHYPPLDLTVDVTAEGGAVVLPLDPGTEPVRFRKVV